MSELLSLFHRFISAIIRRALIWLILLSLALIAGRFYIAAYANQMLLDKGITFEKRSQTLGTINWYKLSADNNLAAQATLSLTLPPRIHLQNVIVTQLPEQRFNKPLPDNLSPSELFGLFQTPIISIEGLSIHLEDLPPLNNLQGDISPLFQLTNEQIEITSTDSGFRVQGEIPLQTPYFSATLQFKIAPPETQHNVYISLQKAIFQHPLLGTTIQFQEIEIIGSWNKDLVDFAISAAPIQATAHGSINLAQQRYDLNLHTSLALAELANLFSIVEMRRDIDVVGDFNLDIHLQGPPLQWSAHISEQALSLQGSLFNVQDIRNGAITYRPINSDNARILGPASSNWVPFHQLGWIPAAAVAAEDSQFWTHNGLNIDGIQIALDSLSQGEQKPPGGSSITQQLAKNIFVDNKRTLKRKTQELLYALALEKYLSKNEIITLYLNAVEFGPNIYGVKDAANTYFLKSPYALTAVEAAFLASLLPAPNSGYRNAQHGKFNRYRVNLILKNMHDGQALTTQEFQRAKSAPLHVIPPAPDAK